MRAPKKYFHSLTRFVHDLFIGDELSLDLDKGLTLKRDMKRYSRLGWFILIVAFFIPFIWACFAPLDKGVPVSGYVIADSNRKEIKQLSGGVVDRVLVHEGELVKRGQLLLVMNEIQARSTINEASSSITGIESQNRGLEIGISEKQKQLNYTKQQLAGLAELSKEDLIPKTKLWDAEKELAQLNASIAADLASIEKNKSQINELLERKSAFQFDLDNTQIKSPVDGYIVGLTQFTNGGVITPGTHLMDIVPLNDDLVVEAQVPVILIDKVNVNLDAEILFTAFNQNRTPHIPAKILMVSSDKYVDEKTGAPYFKVRAVTTEKGRKELKDLHVRPGMPAEVFIKTGERTLISYLLKPFFDRSYSAFREE